MMLPLAKSSQCIKRYEKNPILTSADVPYPSDLVFNAGVAKYQGKYVMVFRNDFDYEGGTCFKGTNLGLAFSEDGLNWKVEKKPFFTQEMITIPGIRRVYDPRITVIDGEAYLCLAADSGHGIRGVVAKTNNFEDLEFLSISVPDNRNMVLFPEKIGGKYCRLERPMPVYSRGGRDRFDMWLSFSPDLRYWGESRLVMGVEDVGFANDKIGPAAPPVKTSKGWLTTFHAVDIDKNRGKNGWENIWQKRYTTGIMLLDLDEPWKIVGMSGQPLIAPEASYETEEGFRQDVVFPGGMILEDDGSVKIYYGASDTVECVAFADCDELIKLCLE